MINISDKPTQVKIFIFIVAGMTVILLISSVILFFKNNSLTHQLSQTKQMFTKMREEADRMESEKEKLLVEKEKLQADTVSYIKVNTDLQRKKDNLEAQAEEAEKAIAANESDLEELRQKLKKAGKKIARTKHLNSEGSAEERGELADKIEALEKILNNERGVYHYNLAVAYTQAKLYDEAIEAYKRALDFDSNNADAHYNLGLLYEKSKSDPYTAVFHYGKYIELKPGADDREDVELWIKKLSE